LFESCVFSGNERVSKEDREFADFPVFSDPDNPYSTFKFHFTPLAFDRLAELMYYNTTHAVDVIRAEMKNQVRVKRRQARAPTRNVRDLASFKYSFRNDGSERLKQLVAKYRVGSVKRREMRPGQENP
jgi:phospholipase A2